MAEKITDSEGREDLVYIKTEDGSYRGWRVDLLVENLSNKMGLKLLVCALCNGLLRDACLYEEELRCGVCIPEGVAWQPVKMNREIVSDKMISCPLKKRRCEWSDTVTTAIHHLEECEFFPVLCPLGCVCLDGERKGKVMKLEKRLIPKHQRDSCPLRELVCEFCMNKLKACEMNPHLEDCEQFPVPCPNECVREGEERTRQMMRRDVPVHLTDVCPLQKVECPYWVYGCREEMERKEMDLHEKEFIHIHYRLSMTDMKQKQIQTSQELDRTTEKISILENESKSKTKELTTANTKIENLEKQISELDSELKSIIEVLYSYTSLSTGQLEWKTHFATPCLSLESEQLIYPRRNTTGETIKDNLCPLIPIPCTNTLPSPKPHCDSPYSQSQEKITTNSPLLDHSMCPSQVTTVVKSGDNFKFTEKQTLEDLRNSEIIVTNSIESRNDLNLKESLRKVRQDTEDIINLGSQEIWIGESNEGSNLSDKSSMPSEVEISSSHKSYPNHETEKTSV
ncbi:TNF receptor-associated factor 4-like [Oopsacas minuta]|uniref:TNF receptor-associated factor 4-like n=1 Tax=Oopsacas minuta TaxID=111878 RepID=A0AAV7KJ07_9METZ|nr:TNF receptor-associated factor 4-like [Oopsacas minuta]